MGVEVSVVRDIVYLRGQVDTERQRRAAERAARSVSYGFQVPNRIVVE
jgi:osmotically-inducible protein OsmY